MRALLSITRVVHVYYAEVQACVLNPDVCAGVLRGCRCDDVSPCSPGSKRGFLFKKKKIDNVWQSRFFELNNTTLRYSKKLSVSKSPGCCTLTRDLCWI